MNDLTLQDAIAIGHRIVTTHEHCIFRVGACADVIATLLPAAMLVKDAAEIAQRSGCVLVTNNDCDSILAMREPLPEGWKRVAICDKGEK